VTNAPHGRPVYSVAACRFRRQLFCGLLGVAAAIGQTKPGALDPREIYKRVEAAVVAVEAIGPDGKPTKTGTGFLISVTEGSSRTTT
jgi:hypothetical protein